MKSIKKIILILITVLLLNGCSFKNINNMTIDKDGKLDYTFNVMIEKNALSNIMHLENENVSITEDAMLQYLNQKINYTFLKDLNKTPISDENYIGYQYTYKVENIDEISDINVKQINLNYYSSKEKLKEIKLFNKTKNKYSANFTFNIKDESSQINNNEEYDLDKINFITQFSVTLPYEPLNHNSKSVTNNGKTLNWTINVNKNETVEFSFSLINIEQIKQLCSIISIVIILISLIIMFTKNKTKKMICILLILVFSSAATIVLFLYTQPVTKMQSQFVNKEINSLNINYENDTISLDFKEINEYANDLNKLINYTSSINDIYSQTINKIIKNDSKTKMYDKENKKILETEISKEQASKIFNNYIGNIEKDTTVKILIDEDLVNKEISNADFEINREDIIRKRIVETALAEVGNTGYKYWNWYNGQEWFMEYCAAFVSWVGEQHGQIEAGNIPKTAWVKEGIDFYKDKGWFKYKKEYTPKPGDIIFFNWNNENDLIDHVGIVEKYKNGYVYTIEGNVGGKEPSKAVARKVVKRKFNKNSIHIYGYGIPNY
ncbi:MAG: CHAP domain-containing protein [Bacilli bacterium]|nr:CHAP domain-containing protein [Bacilli bacterium]